MSRGGAVVIGLPSNLFSNFSPTGRGRPKFEFVNRHLKISSLARSRRKPLAFGFACAAQPCALCLVPHNLCLVPHNLVPCALCRTTLCLVPCAAQPCALCLVPHNLVPCALCRTTLCLVPCAAQPCALCLVPHNLVHRGLFGFGFCSGLPFWQSAILAVCHFGSMPFWQVSVFLRFVKFFTSATLARTSCAIGRTNFVPCAVKFFPSYIAYTAEG